MTMNAPNAASPSTISVSYAGFWIRLGAYLIDFVILFAVLFVFGLVAGVVFGINHAVHMTSASPNAMPTMPAINYTGIVIFYIVEMIGVWLYYAILESSEWRGTIGKKALGLAVTDMNGRRLSFGRATGRYFAKMVSAMVLCVGFIMVAFTGKKQGLHDMMASTSRLPAYF